MHVIALLASLLLIAMGLYYTLGLQNDAGVVLIIIGGLGFVALCAVKPTSHTKFGKPNKF